MNERIRAYFTDDMVAYMERVAGVPWPKCLVRWIAYRTDDGKERLRPRYQDNIAKPQRNPTTRDQFLKIIRSKAAAGVRRDLASVEDEIRRMRDVARHKEQFLDRREEA